MIKNSGFPKLHVVYCNNEKCSLMELIKIPGPMMVFDQQSPGLKSENAAIKLKLASVHCSGVFYP